MNGQQRPQCTVWGRACSTAYQTYKCRCDDCRAWARADRANRAPKDAVMKACPRCGVIRQVKQSSVNRLCQDCQSELTEEEALAW